jgi:hypothetical protein
MDTVRSTRRRPRIAYLDDDDEEDDELEYPGLMIYT